MALNAIAGFHIGGTEPIDDKFLLSKAQMLVFDDNIAPQSFLCCCSDDNKVYQYIKTNDVDETTGKFRVFESGGTTDYSELENKPSINNVELSGNKSADDLGLYTKEETDELLDEKVAKEFVTITQATDWSLLKEGVNAVLIPQNTVLGDFTAPNNLRGYIVKNDSNGNGYVVDWNGSNNFQTLYSESFTSGSYWKVINTNDIVLPVNPTTTPTTEGAMWIETR